MRTRFIFVMLLIIFGSSSAYGQQKYVHLSGHLKIKEDRANIANTIYEDVFYSHPEEHLSEYKKFLPTRRVKITKITISVSKVTTTLGDFFLGDNCLTYDTYEDISPALFPLSAEIHCTGTSVWNANGYERSLSFPAGLGFTIDPYVSLGCPVHVALIFPETLRESDVKEAEVSCRIEYELHEDGDPTYKYIRIPYLDQYPDAPILIRPDVAWYKNWSDGAPLKVLGFSLYYNPKPFRDQTLKDICIFAMDSHREIIETKKRCLPDQVYMAGKTHLQYEPAFFEGGIELIDGESLGGSCTLYKGNNAGDCVLYVLVETHEKFRDTDFSGAPIYYSHGLINNDYYLNAYCNHHIFEQRLTPYGRQVIKAISQTLIEPWSSIRKTKTGKQQNGISSKACKAIFAN